MPNLMRNIIDHNPIPIPSDGDNYKSEVQLRQVSCYKTETEPSAARFEIFWVSEPKRFIKLNLIKEMSRRLSL
jgi:hypothetical protein